MAFIFQDLGKPVVVTGSQLPISAARTDAKMNFVNAILVAGYKAAGLPRIPEVVVVFADKILRGCCTRKVSSKSLAGFNSPNRPPLGIIGEYIEIDIKAIRPMPKEGRKLKVNQEINPGRALQVYLTPGLDPEHLRQILNIKGVDAIILHTFGTGNAPGNEAFLEVIEEARRGKN